MGRLVRVSLRNSVIKFIFFSGEYLLMGFEIEIKVRVASLEPIERRLIEDGAELAADQDEHDIYYNAPHKDFAETDEALRLRYVENQRCGRVMPPCITYKGAKVGREGFKAREEIIVDLSSGEDFSVMLERLGFRKTADVNKHRKIYQVKDAIVTLDSIEGVGVFSEIEAAAGLSEEESVKTIDRIAERYGISGERLTRSYLEIVLEERK